MSHHLFPIPKWPILGESLPYAGNALRRCRNMANLRYSKSFRTSAANSPMRCLATIVFPRESYGLIGKEITFGGNVAPLRGFSDQPIGSWKTAWLHAKKSAGIECVGTIFAIRSFLEVAVNGDTSINGNLCSAPGDR